MGSPEKVGGAALKCYLRNSKSINMNEIPTNSLLANYLPADYSDSFSKEVMTKESITPDAFFNMTFNQFPIWIDWLLKLRNTIVKPLGLDTTSRFSDFVSDRSMNEIIWGRPDKHLDFHVSMWCGEYREGKQELRITTVVKYNNWFGRVYFFVIRLFHGIIIRSLLNRIQRRLEKEITLSNR